MTGCTLLASGQLILTTASSGGTALQPITIPTDPALLGARFYNQALNVPAQPTPPARLGSPLEVLYPPALGL